MAFSSHGERAGETRAEPSLRVTRLLHDSQHLEVTMGKGLLLWLIGIPIPIIILVWLLGGLH
jgi:hypothetical protein